jgi:hypothetical protein
LITYIIKTKSGYFRDDDSPPKVPITHTTGKNLLQHEDQNHEIDVDAGNLKRFVKPMLDKIKSRIDSLVPARVFSSVTLVGESGFDSRVLKQVYTRAEQELMLQTLGELEYSFKTTIFNS